ncbi:hypothetical protein AA103196_3101 [Ameyamaea chiangmaiensis NBRC 103196]|uniref:Uncharacterized protein n=1 Tax=Ameyamaea chiangmaiensis TaxID=442969 RepID=A0A850P8N6_9PROT|nr:hypothetical protein [Ameyamaea chiangmaiensis]MBS4074587.1 hypothetical protein [Ameyamaea chiangmaiensis]NVN39343.1 hypothetical protein [Ameyamaea chiangmaiensis]GBQ72581.1 hypothetical protein AA103196_3101 [Ameyamaea chiangmaiensis NBRC 103196]
MSAAAKDLNAPFIGNKLCNPDGSLTLQGQSFLQRLWARTGYAPGVDSAFLSQEADIAALGTQHAIVSADQASRSADDAAKLSVFNGSSVAIELAQRALDAAVMALGRAQQIEARALKALEIAEELSTIHATTSGNARDGTSSDESMAFAVMTRKWPS